MFSPPPPLPRQEKQQQQKPEAKLHTDYIHILMLHKPFFPKKNKKN